MANQYERNDDELSTLAVNFFENKEVNPETAKRILALYAYETVVGHLGDSSRMSDSSISEAYSVESYVFSYLALLGCDLNHIFHVDDWADLHLHIPTIDGLKPRYTTLARYIFISTIDAFSTYVFFEDGGAELREQVANMITAQASYDEIFQVCEKYTNNHPKVDDIRAELTIMYAAKVVLESDAE